MVSNVVNNNKSKYEIMFGEKTGKDHMTFAWQTIKTVEIINRLRVTLGTPQFKEIVERKNNDVLSDQLEILWYAPFAFERIKGQVIS
ncbi:1449_t:CDS:2 [Entrophospora sp. SA101]|nr:1449_t:CDS:2 [Entrophospora sp. SA101]